MLQAVIALKKGAHLLKYGRRGKPKLCHFRLSVVIFIVMVTLFKLWILTSRSHAKILVALLHLVKLIARDIFRSLAKMTIEICYLLCKPKLVNN